MAVDREVIVQAPDAFQGMKISWGGVFGGVLAGVGALILLSSLGVAIGVSAAQVRDTDGDAIRTGAAIWTGLSLLVSLFIGGWASTRLSMLWEPTTAMFEGVLVWVLSVVIVLYLTASGVALVFGGGFGVRPPLTQLGFSTPSRRPRGSPSAHWSCRCSRRSRVRP